MPHPANAFQTIRNEHAGVAAVLRALLLQAEQGPGEDAQRYYDALRAMLFYIDEFPEQRHHPKESDLLFPRIARIAPQLMPVIRRLESDHVQGESRVRELQHLLLAWELLGESRREAFVSATRDYVRFYLDHMRAEEVQLLPVAERELPPQERAELDAAFSENRDPLANGAGGGAPDPVYERLFARIQAMVTLPGAAAQSAG